MCTNLGTSLDIDGLCGWAVVDVTSEVVGSEILERVVVWWRSDVSTGIETISLGNTIHSNAPNTSVGIGHSSHRGSDNNLRVLHDENFVDCRLKVVSDVGVDENVKNKFNCRMVVLK